jgi:hypothetical protein
MSLEERVAKIESDLNEFRTELRQVKSTPRSSQPKKRLAQALKPLYTGLDGLDFLITTILALELVLTFAHAVKLV